MGQNKGLQIQVFSKFGCTHNKNFAIFHLKKIHISHVKALYFSCNCWTITKKLQYSAEINPQKIFDKSYINSNALVYI